MPFRRDGACYCRVSLRQVGRDGLVARCLRLQICGAGCQRAEDGQLYSPDWQTGTAPSGPGWSVASAAGWSPRLWTHGVGGGHSAAPCNTASAAGWSPRLWTHGVGGHSAAFFSKAAWGTVKQSAREDNGVNETGVLDDALGLRRLDPPGVRFLGHAPVDETRSETQCAFQICFDCGRGHCTAV